MPQIMIEVSDLVLAIIRRIEELDISDAEAARRLKVSPQRLHQWKKGARVYLDRDLQAEIAKFLECSPARVVELMGLSVDTAAC